MPSHKVANPTHIAKCFPRMVRSPFLKQFARAGPAPPSHPLLTPRSCDQSWAPANLYNLYQRTYGPPTAETKFTKSALTMFQQRWKAKQLVRAYHGDWIQEGKFKKEYVPDRLPPIVRKDGKGEKVPLASMMFVEVEKRVDTVVFRCCFADSVYRARMMVVHGKVRLNGVKVSRGN
jgi:ribosomal protein S4